MTHKLVLLSEAKRTRTPEAQFGRGAIRARRNSGEAQFGRGAIRGEEDLVLLHLQCNSQKIFDFP
jgi:hypothetical protein